MFFDVKLPRIRLINGITPLDHAKSLSKILDVTDLFIKRDDCTGIGMGGNKLRKLEFLIADAIKKGADTVVTIGGIQSNHTRLTAFAAKRMGLRSSLILRLPSEESIVEDVDIQGNILLSKIVDSEIHYKYVPNPDMWSKALDEVADNLINNGKRPYIIPSGGACPIGVVGYLYGGIELTDQLLEKNITEATIVCACGSASTLAGLLLAKKYLNMKYRLIGVSVGNNKSFAIERTIKLSEECAAMMKIKVDIKTTDFEIYDEYVGEGYSMLNKQDMLGLKMTALYEGVLLDPVYTARAMGGMIDLINKGMIQREKPIIFIHTGGTPAIFAYSKEINRFQIK